MNRVATRLEARMQRPQRWDVPFDPEMTGRHVDRILGVPPFCNIDPTLFPDRCSLRDILLNDCKLLRCSQGDIVIREGDYGSSAFLILQGAVRVFLEALPGSLTGRGTSRQKSWWATVAQLWRSSPYRERRDYAQQLTGLATREGEDGPHVFLQDFPGVVQANRNLILEEGELFGEVAALSRTPRTATVVADQPTEILEIRWQGLRELMRRTPDLRDHVNRLYRQNSLESHLRETRWLSHLSPDLIKVIADATAFESYGEFEWSRGQRGRPGDDSPTAQIETEPLVESEGNYPDGMLLIRSGFARISQQYGSGHRTLSYLGKGESFGLAELAWNWQHDDSITLRASVRAVGHLDVLRIPTHLIEQHVLPTLTAADLVQICRPIQSESSAARQADQDVERLDVGMIEFLLDHRAINGAQTMLIDLERCTRCDDCVRACAATHDNNPRFIRSGPLHGSVMVAQACMHCRDPVCMIGCPTGAISRDGPTGSVIINDPTCVGCATCAQSCPYQNIIMAEVRDRRGRPIVADDTGLPIVKATKCDFCAEQPLGPACQRACPHDALVRIDMLNVTELAKWVNR